MSTNKVMALTGIGGCGLVVFYHLIDRFQWLPMSMPEQWVPIIALSLIFGVVVIAGLSLWVHLRMKRPEPGHSTSGRRSTSLSADSPGKNSGPFENALILDNSLNGATITAGLNNADIENSIHKAKISGNVGVGAKVVRSGRDATLS